MTPLQNMTGEDILSEDVFIEVFKEEDMVKRQRVIHDLQDRAGELGKKTRFNDLLRVYKKMAEAFEKKEGWQSQTIQDRLTEFEGPYPNMRCGTWIANESGIFMQNQGTTDVIACYHPILPIERMKNLETGDEQIKIAYKRNGKWEEVIIPKDLIATASKITSLSKKGIAVTSENAKLLVRYLADVENFNDQSIEVKYSSSKLGWVKKGFMPYDTDVIFDGNMRFSQIFDSVKEYGSRDEWYGHVRKIRRSGRLEPQIMTASSFGSVLVSLLGCLPFFVDIWGETEGGKTVTLMLACSIWANPDESQYMGDFKTTDVGLETRADLLNHFPMILDDTSKTSNRIRENFEGIVYDLCSGKGKSRSNKDLGMNRECRWRNAILTSGEKPLSSYVIQGGAINRILEVECGEKVYEDPRKTAEAVKENYGFAGREFVRIIKEIGIDKVRQIQQEILDTLYEDEKMQKQSISMSIVLTADRIATDYLFKDGIYIDVEDAKRILTDKTELSDNERCYQYIMSEVDINNAKFDPKNSVGESWGLIEDGWVMIYTNVFDRICKNGGFSRQAFLSWADKHKLIQRNGSKFSKQRRINGKVKRFVFLKLENEIYEKQMELVDDEQEFMDINPNEAPPFP